MSDVVERARGWHVKGAGCCRPSYEFASQQNKSQYCLKEAVSFHNSSLNKKGFSTSVSIVIALHLLININ